MVSSINSPITNETRMMNLRSQIKGLTYRKSLLATRIAEYMGIYGEFLIEDLPLDDPKIPQDLVDEFTFISNELSEAHLNLSKLENPHTAHAKQKVYSLINTMSLDESIQFLKRYDCKNTLELVDKLSNNPNLLDMEADAL